MRITAAITTVGVEGFGLRVQEGHKIGNLGLGNAKGGHSFIRPAEFHNGADEIAVFILAYQFGVDQIRPHGPGGVFAMAEGARLHKLLVAALDVSFLGMGAFGSRRSFLRVEGHDDRKDSEHDERRLDMRDLTQMSRAPALDG